MKRPLAMAALLYAGGLLLAEVCQPLLPILFAWSLLLTVVAIGLARARGFLIWPLIVCAGWTNLVWRAAIVSPNDLRLTQGNSAEIVSVRGVLAETPGRRVFVRDEEEAWRTMAQVKMRSRSDHGSWRPAFGEIVVTTPGLLPDGFFAGQAVEITGVLAPPPAPLAEGLFDFRTYLRRKEIYYRLKTESSNDWRIVGPVKTIAPLADRFRAWARKALALGLPVEDESLRLEWALALGDKTVLTDEVSEPFVRAATYHIFAVDGLRMAIVFAISFALCRVVGLPRAWSGLVLVPLIWFYTALTGWPASAIRAAVMLTVIIIGWALKRPSDLINSLMAAALIILVWDPQQLFQAGFQLSFLVVLCIILILPAFDEFSQRLLKSDPLLPDELRPRWQKLLIPPARFVLDFLFTSLAAWLGSIPLAAYYFNIFTAVSGPANLVAVPLCALTLMSNFISLLLAGWFPGGAEIFNHAGWFLMECIRASSQWFEQWPAAYFYVSTPGLFTIALYYAILLAVLTGWLFKPKGRAWKISGLVLLSVFWCVQWRRENLITRMTALPLSGGSAVYCDAPGAKNDLLVDCGNSNSVDLVMKPFLRAHGVNGLACVALTHGDLRHVGGVKLLETVFPMEQLATSSVRFSSPVYRAAVQELQTAPGRRRTVNRGDEIRGWTVLHPNPDDHFPAADDNALVLRGEFAGTRVLLLSDLGRSGQNSLLERQSDLRAEIVVACLPESGEPAGEALLDAIQPEVVIITDSEFPAAKRAGAKLRERLQRRGVPVIFTSEAGAVKISLSQNRWDISPMTGVSISGSPGRR